MTRDDVIRATAAHIRRVGTLMADCASRLTHRAVNHDESKWSEEEWPHFEAATPKLAGTTYGTDEYRALLREIKPALVHHNAVNRHHPEFYPNGIHGMDLLDLIEMLCDWKAATERHNDGDLTRSIIMNAERFKYGEDIKNLLLLTAENLGMIPKIAKESP